MSFTFASYNEYGIVITADRRFTGSNQDGFVNVATNAGRKLFLSVQGYAISFAGGAMQNSIPTSKLISDTLNELSGEFTLSAFFAEFINRMVPLCPKNVIFLAAGYEDGQPRIYTATTTNPELVLLGGIGYAGETDLGQKILCAIPIAYSSMPLQDRLDFHRFVTATISKLQSFSDHGITVSEECDAVVIGPSGVLFSEFSELH